MNPSKLLLAALLLSQVFLGGCTGSGAVNPLSPTKASTPEAVAETDSDVIYWTPFPLTFSVTDTLNGICMVSKKFGMACGNNSLLLRWDGDTWNQVTSGLANNENLMAMGFVNENEGWAVGTHGVILHYNNGNWLLDPSPTQNTLFGIYVTRYRTAWAVGAAGTMLNYNGISWGPVTLAPAPGGAPTSLTEDIYSISMADSNNGWAVGDLGLILKFDGQKWSNYTGTPPTTEKINSVSALNSVQAWAVGAFGTILSYNGTAWTKVGNAFSGFDLYNVGMRGESDGWAVGQDGLITYYDGTRWISHPKPDGKPALNAISFYKDVGFIVGQSGTILKYQTNGEPTLSSFLFKGEIARKPTKDSNYWTVAYTILNQSPKTSAAVTFEMPIPKGLEPYQPKLSPTPTGTLTAPVTLAPTPTYTPVPVTTSATPGKSSKAAPKIVTAVAGTWKMNDHNLDWEVGTVASSEIMAVTVLLENKKNEKKDYPLVLKAVLKSNDKVVSEALPVTLLASEPKAPTTPAALTNTAGEPVSTGSGTPAKGVSQEGGLPNATPAATPGP